MPSEANASRTALMMLRVTALRAAVSGARTITWWRVGYWVVGSQWLKRESKDGFTTARTHRENDSCGYGLPTFVDSAAKG